MFAVGKEFPDVAVLTLLSPHCLLPWPCSARSCSGSCGWNVSALGVSHCRLTGMFIFDGQGFWRPCTPCKDKAMQVGPALFILIYKPHFIIWKSTFWCHFPERFWTAHPWKCSSGWTVLGATWDSGRFPCLWNEMGFHVPSIPNNSGIWWFYYMVEMFLIIF